MGMTKKQINQPFVGVVSTWNESAPAILPKKTSTSCKKRSVDAEGTPENLQQLLLQMV